MYLQETDPPYKQASLWEAPGLRSYFSGKNIALGDIDEIVIQREIETVKHKIDKCFKDWTLYEVILSAYVYVFISFKDPFLIQILKHLNTNFNAVIETESIKQKLQGANIDEAAKEYQRLSDSDKEFIRSLKTDQELEIYFKNFFEGFLFNSNLCRNLSKVKLTALADDGQAFLKDKIVSSFGS